MAKDNKNHTQTENNPIKNLKTIICDDDNQIQEFLGNMLNEEGHTVDLAKDGEEVFKLLGKTKYDLLILDVNIPKLNGYKVSEKICKNIKNRPKILIFTVRDIESEKPQFISSDADAILQKGTPINDILQVIHGLFAKRENASDKTPIAPSQPASFLSAKDMEKDENFNLQRSEDIQLCFDKISKVEKLITGKMKAHEEFIKYILIEKQATEKKFSELKLFEIKLKKMEKWIYAIFIISTLAILKYFI